MKVLDFGLAKAMEQRSAGGGGTANPAISSTITSPAMTMRGMILGTAAYMSPEQAKGKPVDARSDIWAFGCVFYEMLAGRRAFEGEDVSDTLAAILRGEPDWTRLPALPSALHTLLRRCVERDWRRRIASMSVVRFVLDQPAVVAPPDASAAPAAGELQSRIDVAVAQGRRRLFVQGGIPLLVLTTVAVAAALGFAREGTRTPLPPAVTRFVFPLPERRVIGRSSRYIALSPSGNELAYATIEGQMLLRRLSQFEMAPISGVDLGGSLQLPAFSPDGEWLAYYTAEERVVKKVSVRGGAALRICDVVAISLDWDASGILAATPTGAVRCSPAGGAPEQLVQVEAREQVLAPQILPGGDALLFTVAKVGQGTSTRWDEATVVVQSLRTGERKTILQGGSDARFVSTGHLIYAVGGTVFAVPFDPHALELRGTAVSVVEGVRRSSSGALQLAVSASGALVYLPGPTGTDTVTNRLAIGDRSGNVTQVPVSPAAYTHVRVSPDGTRAAIGTDDGKQASVLIYGLNGSSAVQRLALDGRSRFPIWSPDGHWIAFQSDRAGDLGIFRQRADGIGGAERLTTATAGEEHVPESWSPNGRHLSFAIRNTSGGGTGYALHMLALTEKTTAPFGDITSVDPIGSVFSPDGKWLAYAKGTALSVRDVNRGVFVQPFPATGTVYQVPRLMVDFHPTWSASGKELVFTGSGTAQQMVVVRVATSEGLSFGAPVPFPATVSGDRISREPRAWDVLPDGRLIGITAGAEQRTRSSSPELRVVLNWFEELKQRVPMP